MSTAMSEGHDDAVMTSAEVAAILGCSPDTVSRMAQRRELIEVVYRGAPGQRNGYRWIKSPKDSDRLRSSLKFRQAQRRVEERAEEIDAFAMLDREQRMHEQTAAELVRALKDNRRLREELAASRGAPARR